MDSKGTVADRSPGKLSSFLLGFILLGLAAFLAWNAENPPAPTTNSEHDFSATQAMANLSRLLKEGVPHPTGAATNSEVRRRIFAELQGMGYSPEEQSSFICSSLGTCAEVHNVLARLPGRAPGPYVMLAAHYDSVGAGPGASDDGANVAILLEIAQLLKADPTLPYPVLFLFDDGEEQVLLGATAFVERHPWAHDVRWAVNLEARGTAGPSLMFETSDDDAALIKLYARVVRRPVTSSLMYSLYRILPSDTDFTIFKAHGIQGFNMAYIGNAGLYHRAGDSVANTSAASVQQQGNAALSLVRALATLPPAEHGVSDAVFFDIFHVTLWWPKSITIYLVALALGFLLAASIKLGRTRIKPLSVLGGIFALFLALFMALVCGLLLQRILIPGGLLPPSWVAYPVPFSIVFVALGLIVSGLIVALISRRTTQCGFLLGNWIGWLALALVVHTSVFGGAYLFVVPAFAAGLMFLIVAFLGVDSPYATESTILVPALVVAVLWVPLLHILYEGLGKVSLPFVSLSMTLLFILLLPLLWGSHRLIYRMVLVAAAVVIAVGGVCVFLPTYSEKSPQPVNILYSQEDMGEPQWLLSVGRGRVPQALMQAGSFNPAPVNAIPWSRDTVFAAKAPRLPLAFPQMEIISQIQQPHGELRIHARLLSPRGADRIMMLFPPKVSIASMNVGGQPVPELPPDYLPWFNGWQQYTSTTLPEGVNVEFTLSRSDPIDILVVDESFGIPHEGDSLLVARPKTASAARDGDATLLLRHVKLGGAAP